MPLLRVHALRLVVAAVSVLVASTGTTGTTAKVNGIEIYYETAGSGEPLLLLHSGTQSSEMFAPFVDELGASYRLIIPDLRGHGHSTNPDSLWTTRQFASDMFALLDHLGIERVRAIGASAGGMTLLHMATEQPDRLHAMVVIGVGTYLPQHCRTILSQTDASTLPAAAWERLRTRHVHGDEQIRALYDWVASLATSYGDMSFTPPLLATISAPTMVVHGDSDYCFPPSMAVEVASAIPQSALWVVPNGSHVPIGEHNAAEFVEAALRFFASHP